MPSTMPLFIMDQTYSVTCLELFRSRLFAHLLLNFYFIVLFGSALMYLVYQYNKLNDRMKYVRQKYRNIKKKCLSGMIMETLCEDLSVSEYTDDSENDSEDRDSVEGEDGSDNENEEHESQSSYEMDEENEEDYRIEDEDEDEDEERGEDDVEDYETVYDIVDETDMPEENESNNENDENVKGLEVIGKSIPIHKTDIRYNLRSKTKITLVDYSDEAEVEDEIEDEAEVEDEIEDEAEVEVSGNNSEEHILKSSQYVFDNCGDF